EIAFVGAVAEDPGCLDRRVQAELLGPRQDAAGEGKLDHRLAARDGQAAVERAQSGGKSLQTIDRLLRRDVGSVLEMPGVGVVAIRAAQQATRYEQHDPQAGTVVAGRGLVGMRKTE